MTRDPVTPSTRDPVTPRQTRQPRDPVTPSSSPGVTGSRLPPSPDPRGVTASRGHASQPGSRGHASQSRPKRGHGVTPPSPDPRGVTGSRGHASQPDSKGSRGHVSQSRPKRGHGVTPPSPESRLKRGDGVTPPSPQSRPKRGDGVTPPSPESQLKRGHGVTPPSPESRLRRGHGVTPPSPQSRPKRGHGVTPPSPESQLKRGRDFISRQRPLPHVSGPGFGPLTPRDSLSSGAPLSLNPRLLDPASSHQADDEDTSTCAEKRVGGRDAALLEHTAAQNTASEALRNPSLTPPMLEAVEEAEGHEAHLVAGEGPGVPGMGGGGAQHSRLQVGDSAGHSSQILQQTPRSLRPLCLQPKNPEASAHPAFGHCLSVSGLVCLLSSLGASCQVLLLLNELLLLPAATAAHASRERARR